MSAQENLSAQQFDARWSTGKCGTYACAVMKGKPGTRLGVAGYSELGGGDASEGWMPSHYFAHDDQNAYDSAGVHPLPYHGINNQFDYVELNHDPKNWSLPQEEGATPDTLQQATEHAHKIGVL